MKTLKTYGWMLLLAILPATGWAQTAGSADTLHINLEQALQIALSDNLTIKIAEQEIQRVDYSKKAAWYGLIPTLNGSVQASKSVLQDIIPAKVSMLGSVMDSPSDYNVAANLNLALPLIAPGLWKSIQLSDMDLQLAVEKARGSKIDLRNEVKKAYYNILLAQASIVTLQEALDIADENFRLSKERFNVGMVAEYDMVSAEVQAQNLRPQLVQAENGARQAKLYMKVLLGIDVEQPIAVEGALSDFENSLTPANNTASLDGNSSLAQIDLQLKMLDKQRQLLVTQMLPTLAAFGQYGYSGSGNRAITINLGGAPIQTEASNDWFSNGLIVGLQLNIPIFNGLTDVVKIKQAKIATKQLQLQRDYTVAGLESQVITQHNNMTMAMEQVKATKKGAELAEKGHTIAQKRYETGGSTILELQDATRALTQARLQHSQAIADYLSAKADYEKLIGQ